MNSTEASKATRIKVGIFTIGALLLIGLSTVIVNDKPYWWRSCQLVHINVEDATGLKAKSGVRSLGLEIGYLKSVVLAETHVDLGICITEKVEVLPSTRAYIRSEGFLGDKFVELKPVKYLGPGSETPPSNNGKEHGARSTAPFFFAQLFEKLVSPAYAEETETKPSRQIPVGEGSQDVQNLVKRVDSLVNEMTGLTNHLRDAINPEDLRATMKQLNRTLENASKTLSPEGGLNQTAQRTLAKLEDAIDQLRDMATRINQGQGSLGMLLNDPSYAEEIRQVIKNANALLSKVSGIRFNIDIGAEKFQGYDTSRGWFQLAIWPTADHYYLIGFSIDPRGRSTVTNNAVTTTVPGGSSTTINTYSNSVEQTGVLVTGMVGKVFYKRLDLSLGAKYGDGTVSLGGFLGPQNDVERYQVRMDVYSRAAGGLSPVDARVSAIARIFMGAYVRVGLESFQKINGLTPFSYGGGVTFDDNDIKLLFALR